MLPDAQLKTDKDSGLINKWHTTAVKILLCYSLINLLSPKSDKHLISPYIITTWSNTQVLRINEVITKRQLA